MKALILAAGLGSRLAPLTNDKPKSLVCVNGKPILMKQLENLHENGITDILIVGGYLYSVLEKEVHAVYPDIKILNSTDYANTNNMYSAYLGIQKIKGESFLMMNADVFYDSSVIKKLLSFEAPNAVVTDIGRYLEESMKVEYNNGHLTKISKAIPKENAYGTTIDVYKFSNIGGAAFFEKCREYIEDKKEMKLWSEVALNDILNEVIFQPCPLDGRWFEIDNHQDLAEAEVLFKD